MLVNVDVRFGSEAGEEESKELCELEGPSVTTTLWVSFPETKVVVYCVPIAVEAGKSEGRSVTTTV